MKEIKNILSLLLSTILMLKKSNIKNHLCKIMKKLNILSMQYHFEKINLTEDLIEDMRIISEDMDLWIRHYSYFEIRMPIKRELLNNLKELENIFTQLVS
jgi:hypothetical protein